MDVASSSSSAHDPNWLSPQMKYKLAERSVGREGPAEIYTAAEIDTNKVLAVKVWDKEENRLREKLRRRSIRAEGEILQIVRGGVSTVLLEVQRNSVLYWDDPLLMPQPA